MQAIMRNRPLRTELIEVLISVATHSAQCPLSDKCGTSLKTTLTLKMRARSSAPSTAFIKRILSHLMTVEVSAVRLSGRSRKSYFLSALSLLLML